MATLTKAICVWLDETSDRENPAWIVSLDELDEAGRAVTTHTLDTFEEDEEARADEEGRKQARRRGLPFYRNSEQGPAVLVEHL